MSSSWQKFLAKYKIMQKDKKQLHLSAPGFYLPTCAANTIKALKYFKNTLNAFKICKKAMLPELLMDSPEHK